VSEFYVCERDARSMALVVEEWGYPRVLEEIDRRGRWYSFGPDVTVWFTDELGKAVRNVHLCTRPGSVLYPAGVRRIVLGMEFLSELAEADLLLMTASDKRLEAILVRLGWKRGVLDRDGATWEVCYKRLVEEHANGFSLSPTESSAEAEG